MVVFQISLKDPISHSYPHNCEFQSPAMILSNIEMNVKLFGWLHTIVLYQPFSYHANKNSESKKQPESRESSAGHELLV